MNVMKTQDIIMNQKNRNRFRIQLPITAIKIKRLTRAWFLKFLKVQMVVQKLLSEDLGKIVNLEVQGHLQTVFKESLVLIKNQVILLRLKKLESLQLQKQLH